MEIIQAIIECNFKKDRNSFEGFIIKTDKRGISIGIEDHQSCCENAGYLVSHDDIESFVGASLIEIKIVDSALNTEMWNDEDKFYQGEPSNVMFVNLETNKGTLQITAYNDHNGYYGHNAVVLDSSGSFSHEECL